VRFHPQIPTKTFKNPSSIDNDIMKKGSFRASLIFLLAACLIIFATAAFVAEMESEDKITANSIRINNHNTIRVPDSHQPLPSTDEGTIVLWTKPPVEIFDQFSDARDYIIFFSSTNIPGLRIVYNLQTRTFEAGTPLMSSPEIDIFDGKNHQLVYTYKKGLEQAIFLDGVKVDSSGFRPMEISKVTGMAVALPMLDEVDVTGLEVAVYDRYMGESI